MFQKIKVENNGCFWVWLMGWLFTIGYLGLTFWKGVAAVVLWPYYIGMVVAGLSVLW